MGGGRLWLFLPEEEQQNEAQYREEKQGDILGRAPVPSAACRVGSQEGEHVQQHGRVHGPKRLVASKYHPRKQEGDDGDGSHEGSGVAVEESVVPMPVDVVEDRVAMMTRDATKAAELK